MPLNQTWSKPVTLSFAASGAQVVTGPFEALIHLTDHWPHRGGLKFVKARSACRAAIDGRKSVEDARLEFEEAAKEAQAIG
jgi:hypothetical protein